MGYKLTPEHGWLLRMVLWNPFGPGEAHLMVDKIYRMTAKWDRVACLLDLSAIGKVPGPMGKAFADAAEKIKRPRPNRVAIVGASRAVRVVAGFVVSVVPRYQNTRFFDKEAEALKWLFEKEWPEVPADLWSMEDP